MNDPIYSYPLAETAFISVGGVDAQAFLQAQLALNLHTLTGNGARLAPWLNAKGRVTALFSLARLPEGSWLLAVHRSQSDELVKRLRMFVLRAAVEISPANDRWQALVIAGAALDTAASRFPLAGGVHGWDHRDGLLWRATIPGALEVWGPPAGLAGLRDVLAEDPRALNLWRWRWLAAGLPSVTLEQQDRFTGHMLNLDLLGALSFDKGCYPGQEVVARTENLGRPKRRALLFQCGDDAPEPGGRVVDVEGESLGEIVSTATGHPNLTLAVVTLAESKKPLYLDSGAGARLLPAALPYAIPEL